MIKHPSAFFLLLVAWVFSSPCPAQEEPAGNGPILADFTIGMPQTAQGRPVRMNFNVTNEGVETAYSQRPYSGATYSLYHSFRGLNLRPLPGRYMVGISLDGGEDGYPYRWGFRGPLGSGRHSHIVGYLNFLEAGTYEITAALLREDTPLAENIHTGQVLVTVHEPPVIHRAPVPAQRIFPVVNGRRFPPTLPYFVGGHLFLEVRPFVGYVTADIFVLDRQIILRRPGVEVILVPGSPIAIVNGVRVVMPVPVQRIGGITYVPVRFISPFFGHTFYYFSDTRGLFLYGP